MRITTMDEMRDLGLVDNSPALHLTTKGRDWLRTLEDVGHENEDVEEAAADLVLSTNGLFR